MSTLLIGGGPLANVNLIGICLDHNMSSYTSFVGVGASCILALALSLGDDISKIISFYEGFWKIGLGTDLVYPGATGGSGSLINWYPIRKHIESRIGNPTFSELFSRCGTSLGIVAYNLSKTCFAYFSTQNSPQMKVLDAIHLSLNIPEYFYPTIFENDIYIDPSYVNSIPLEFLSQKVDLSTSCLFYLDRTSPRIGHKHVEKWARLAPVIENEIRSLSQKWGFKSTNYVTCLNIVPLEVTPQEVSAILARSMIEASTPKVITSKASTQR